MNIVKSFIVAGVVGACLLVPNTSFAAENTPAHAVAKKHAKHRHKAALKADGVKTAMAKPSAKPGAMKAMSKAAVKPMSKPVARNAKPSGKALAAHVRPSGKMHSGLKSKSASAHIPSTQEPRREML